MKIEQIYTGCLSQGAYYIRSENEAIVIDPLREIESYVQKALHDHVKIKYVLETHFHADFVSGHLDLAAKTGATIVYGPSAQPGFPAYIAADGEELPVGKCTMKVLHTPGHTMESTCYLLLDENRNQVALFSGDTLLLGDVGRPDLAQKATNLTTDELAGLLYDSIRNKLLPLADDVIIYPGHGAGSACGKNMMKETVDTLGHQKKINYALRKAMTRQEFITEVTDGLSSPPAYFPENAKMNKHGYESIDVVIRKGTRPMSVAEFNDLAAQTDAVIIDTREAKHFEKGFIPGSINIGLNGSFAHWVGSLLRGTDSPVLIVAEEGQEKEAAIRLARVGYDHLLGYLKGGFQQWLQADKDFNTITSMDAEEFSSRNSKQKLYILDVRRADEFKAGHIIGAHHLPLEKLATHLDQITKEADVYIHCAGGYRSMIAASILRSKGWVNIINVTGGFQAISNAKKQVALDKPEPVH